MLFHMYQVFNSLLGHLHFSVHFLFTFMEQLFNDHPIYKCKRECMCICLFVAVCDCVCVFCWGQCPIIIVYYKRRPHRNENWQSRGRFRVSIVGQINQKPRLKVLGHSLMCLLVCSHRSLVCLLRTACFARLLTHFAHSLARRKRNDWKAVFSMFFLNSGP